MDYEELIRHIKLGEFDDNLDGLTSAIKARRDAIQPQIWEFVVGERVRIKSTAKPTYLRGATATIKKINRTRLVIDFDIAHGKFYRNVTTPVTIIERVS